MPVPILDFNRKSSSHVESVSCFFVGEVVNPARSTGGTKCVEGRSERGGDFDPRVSGRLGRENNERGSLPVQVENLKFFLETLFFVYGVPFFRDYLEGDLL